jgi:hypothetical protein
MRRSPCWEADSHSANQEMKPEGSLPCSQEPQFRVVPVLWAPCHEGVLGEWRYNSSTHSLTSALDGGEWSASRPGRFTPRERAPGNHWIEGWVGPRAVLDAAVKRKIPSLRRESNPKTPIVQPVAQRYTDWAITAPITRPCDIFRNKLFFSASC